MRMCQKGSVTQTVWLWGRHGQTSGTKQKTLEMDLRASGNPAPAKDGISRWGTARTCSLWSGELAAAGCPGWGMVPTELKSLPEPQSVLLFRPRVIAMSVVQRRSHQSGGPLMQHGWCPYKKRHRDTHEDSHVTMGADIGERHLQPGTRGRPAISRSGMGRGSSPR